jgi:putative zinc finger/helix-turn-helix YgiT family protein
MKKETIAMDIPIPSSDGKTVAYTVPVELSARFDEELQDYVLDGNAMAEIDRVKARHMGLLSPNEMKALRARLGLNQKQIGELLQIGAKSWSRWENGRERPSRSINLLLRSLNDGKIDVNYLRAVSTGSRVSPKIISFIKGRDRMRKRSLSVELDDEKVCKNDVQVA